MSERTADGPRREPHAGEPIHRPWAAATLTLGFAAAMAVGLTHLPTEGAPLPAIARHAVEIALPLWKTTEVVNEIVYGTRGFDTFGETFLLLAAVVSVVVLTRGTERRQEYVGESEAGARERGAADPPEGQSGGSGSDEQAEAREAEHAEESEGPTRSADLLPVGAPAPERSSEMTVIVRIAARAAAVIVTVAGVYIAAWGYSPGGGFPAGAALAGVAVLLYAALGYPRIRRVVRPTVLETLEMAGAAAIIGVGLAGLVLEGSFTGNWAPLAPLETIRSGGVMQLFSGAELIEVGTGLTIAIFTLLGMGHEWTPDRDQQEQSSDEDGSGKGSGQ
jgi:multicomponent Na+:H+ antiporter subunit B